MWEILQGDVRERLADIPDGSIQCCVTSPPYWGLRDYGTATWDGGYALCDHSHFLGGHGNKSMMQTSSAGTQKYQYKEVCRKCGARRIDSQIGLEQTPDEYVQQIVDVMGGVRRVLADDGVLWLNLGDSYAGSGKARNADGLVNVDPNSKQATSLGTILGTLQKVTPDGLKPKDLVGIPWRVAFALQADGWWLRQDIIWHKPNPMPESVTDRCTKSHEYLFMLTKSAKYFFDNKAIQEPSVALGKTSIRFGGNKYGDSTDPKHATKSGNTYTDTGLRNKRSVWTIPTKPFRGAHFAVMPEALVEPCILATSRHGDTILDPFNGSGTVGVVALRHGRNYIGCELNPEYVSIAEERLNSVCPTLPDIV